MGKAPVTQSVTELIEPGLLANELELVDVSPSGMQLRCMDFDAIKDGLEPTGNLAQFTILLQARLAWVQTAENQEFLTGWEFGEDTGEERIG